MNIPARVDIRIVSQLARSVKQKSGTAIRIVRVAGLRYTLVKTSVKIIHKDWAYEPVSTHEKQIEG